MFATDDPGEVVGPLHQLLLREHVIEDDPGYEGVGRIQLLSDHSLVMEQLLTLTLHTLVHLLWCCWLYLETVDAEVRSIGRKLWCHNTVDQRNILCRICHLQTSCTLWLLMMFYLIEDTGLNHVSTTLFCSMLAVEVPSRTICRKLKHRHYIDVDC